MVKGIFVNSGLENEIKQIFIKIFPYIEENFDFKRNQEDYENWDSLTHFNLITELEKKFDVKLKVDEIVSIYSAEQALEIIKGKKNVSS